MKKTFVCVLMVVALLCMTVPSFALQYQGEWVDFVTYSPDDVVKYVPNGIVYVAIGSGLAVPPPSDPTNWVMLFISSGDAVEPEWSEWIDDWSVDKDNTLIHDFTSDIVDNTVGFIEAECILQSSDNSIYRVDESKLGWKKINGFLNVVYYYHELGSSNPKCQLMGIGMPATGAKLYLTSYTGSLHFHGKFRYRIHYRAKN